MDEPSSLNSLRPVKPRRALPPLPPLLLDETGGERGGSGVFVDQLKSYRPADPIDKKYECPLCSNYLLPPIYQCCNGHTICHECEHKVKKCPTCNEDLPSKKVRSLILEEIVVGLKFDCRNKQFGCPFKNLNYNQIQLHTPTCLFVELPYCELLNLSCSEKFYADYIITHLRSAHKITGVDLNFKKGDTHFIKIYQSLPQVKLKGTKKIYMAPHYLEWEGQLFFIRTNYDTQEKCCAWMICMAVIGNTSLDAESSAKTSDFLASIKLVSKVSKVNTLEWRGEVGELTTKFDLNQFTFSVPVKTLESFTMTKGDDRFEWTIHVQLMKRESSSAKQSFQFNRTRSKAVRKMLKANEIPVSTPPTLEVKERNAGSKPPCPTPRLLINSYQGKVKERADVDVRPVPVAELRSDLW